MKRRMWTAVLSAAGMLVLILDSKTALSGAAEGVSLCLRVVIPSLLPFFVISILLTSALTGTAQPFLRPIRRLCGIPAGGESLLIVGLLGGYPVGAQNVAAAFQDGQLSNRTAKRMLGFCSNAGPAFIFGIVAGKFEKWWFPWLLWGIHIISSVLVGMLLPGKDTGDIQLKQKEPLSLQASLQRSIRVMANVCGWIVLFRIIIAFAQRWFLWLLPESGQAVFSGILELTNGCCQLESIENTGLRFIAASGLLAFGGLCVAMQTAAVTGKLGLGAYLPGKLLQTAISVLLAFLVQLFFPAEDHFVLSGTAAAVLPVALAFFAVILRESEKRSSIPGPLGV